MFPEHPILIYFLVIIGGVELLRRLKKNPPKISVPKEVGSEGLVKKNIPHHILIFVVIFWGVCLYFFLTNPDVFWIVQFFFSQEFWGAVLEDISNSLTNLIL